MPLDTSVGKIFYCVVNIENNLLLSSFSSSSSSSFFKDLSISMLRKVLNKVEIIKRSRSGIPNFESHEIEANDLQSAVSQYMNLRGTAKVCMHDIAYAEFFRLTDTITFINVDIQ